VTAVTDLTRRLLSGWCDLPCSPMASSIARRWVSAMLASWDLPLCAASEATIAELTSELVTNAVQHAALPARGSCDIRINVRVGDTTVWLAVCDPDPTLPTQRAPDFLAESGRGLFLVDAQADQWGAVQHEAGKYVWFSLECLDGVRGAGQAPPARTFAERYLSFPTTSAAPGRTA
jgi:anti-sigma regulatory factor (Ser/Thr protein kinase)